MYGTSSKKRCFLKKIGNTFITIKQLCIWYLVLYVLANFSQGTKKLVRFREASNYGGFN